MKHAEVLHANLKEERADYQNLRKESNTGEVFYGNLNPNKNAKLKKEITIIEEK